MSSTELFSSLESVERARPWLERWQAHDIERGWKNLSLLRDHLSQEAAERLAPVLCQFLPDSADTDLALHNLERFFSKPACREKLGWLLEENGRSLEVLLGLFSTSQYFSDLIITDPSFLSMIRVPLRTSPTRDELIEELQQEIESAFDESSVYRAFRQFRQRQLLRIGTNDIVRDRPFNEIVNDISQVADASLECAYRFAYSKITEKNGEPHKENGQLCTCVILAFGKHGGEELNYSSDIDIMFLYDEEGSSKGKSRSLSNSEIYARIASEVARLLSAYTENGQAYRVDLRLRPEGQRGPMARSFDSTLSYYDTLGRTWERQALIKLRPVAGDLELGKRFLEAIEPFIYRRYLGFTEINGIKALKRKIEQRTERDGTTWTEVKTGHGGIRDIEFTIQFLQLLNGGDLPEIRQRNTLKAIDALDRAGCLTDQEMRLLEENYRFLRRVEHFLQLMFDQQTHRLPEKPEEVDRLARRLGFQATDEEDCQSAGEAFLKIYRKRTEVTRHILDHLLHQTFEGQEEAHPAHDLILDPDPDAMTIERALGRYQFRDVKQAYHHLMELARESIPFLSDRRCRHFLASIAPALLTAVSETPDPDSTLVTLAKVSASLGGKSVLWESFSFHPSSLKLYVELCAWSSFLSEILINNPGMIDELLDTLVLNQPRTAEELRAELNDLCQGVPLPILRSGFGEHGSATLRHADEQEATNTLQPILHSFQSTQLLRIGVRDILGKDNIRNTMGSLSDLAETLLSQIAKVQFPLLTQRMGVPMCKGCEQDQLMPCRYVVLGLGKLGGRELSYHSDLDLILVYQGSGQTELPQGATRFNSIELTSNLHFFTELAQRIIKMTSQLGPYGRLYEIDMRLRPTGRSGSLVISLSELKRYFQEDGGAQLWERQAMTRARVVYGNETFGEQVMDALFDSVYGRPWQPSMAEEIHSMRTRLESSRSKKNIKRGVGGLVDIEFLVQLYHLKLGGSMPELQRTRNVWDSLVILREKDILSEEQYTDLLEAYNFLLSVQSRLRIIQNRSIDEVPADEVELDKLARHLGVEVSEGESPGSILMERLTRHKTRIRELFLQLIEQETPGSE